MGGFLESLGLPILALCNKLFSANMVQPTKELRKQKRQHFSEWINRRCIRELTEDVFRMYAQYSRK